MPNRKYGINANEREWIDMSVKGEPNRASSIATGSSVDANAWEYKVAAFVQTAEEQRAYLMRLAHRMTNSREDAEDVVQLGLMKAFANLSRFRHESQMKTWLHAIVRNTASELLRNRGGRVFQSLEYVRSAGDDPIVIDLPDPRRNPEEHWERKEMEGILLSEIDELPALCKRAIQMCFFEGIPCLAAANALNVSAASVKSRIFRGRQILKRTVCRQAGMRSPQIAQNLNMQP